MKRNKYQNIVFYKFCIQTSNAFQVLDQGRNRPIADFDITFD